MQGLSRSTLLYYDRIGLLKPSSRKEESGYRLYDESAIARLQTISTYRKAGLTLDEIARVLDSPDNPRRTILENRLKELDNELNSIRSQQRLILFLLQRRADVSEFTSLTKKSWTKILAKAGFSNDEMMLWHYEFEQNNPEQHQAFLEILGLQKEEITRIREEATNHTVNEQ